MKLVDELHRHQRDGYVDLGPTWLSADYDEGYVHMHTTHNTGGRGTGSTYVKLRPDEARRWAQTLLAAAAKHDEGAA